MVVNLLSAGIITRVVAIVSVTYYGTTSSRWWPR